ncbi:MAG: SMC-Scp complex subunit ScpB [Gemmatimonadetes bacterium]|nr:SMC-Scp complex subunit ScpB [Gemmatimonadota bacterium]
MRLTQTIEALLFASDAPLSAADLSRVDERLDEDTVEAVIQELRAEYELSERSFQIYEVGGGFQLLTRPEFVTVLERYDSVPQPSRLSSPALEVLAIIAYRQPLGRAEIEDIRGVGSSGVLRTLQERSLVEPVARGEGLGRPLLYGTTRKFLEHFGFRSLEDLPRPDELPVVLRDRTPPNTLPLEDDDTADSNAADEAPAAGPADVTLDAVPARDARVDEDPATDTSDDDVTAPDTRDDDVPAPDTRDDDVSAPDARHDDVPAPDTSEDDDPALARSVDGDPAPATNDVEYDEASQR